MEFTESRILYNTVIKNNYCIGCGACATVENSPFKMQMDEYGNIVAMAEEENIDKSDARVLQICPFSGVSKNEDEISNLVFPDNKKDDKYIGKFLACYAGYATDDSIRSIGSSGGIGKWLSYKLLADNYVDYYVQVTPNNDGESGKELFKYAIFSDKTEVVHGSTSAYYPTTMHNVIQEIKRNPGRYAITGVPCFVKAIRLLTLEDALLKERIKYTVGIVCGSMKSANQSKMIAWQLGVHPDNLVKIDFRGKQYGVTPATTKMYRVWSNTDNEVHEKKSGEIFGADYGMGFFKPNACDFCDDVVGETSDISIGDVWLPQYRFDTKGYSLIIVRNKELFNLLDESKNKNEIHLETLSPAQAFKTQEGGFRHRRDALSYRLQKKKDQNVWYPEKRVMPGEFVIDKKRKKIYDLREEIAHFSHDAFIQTLKSGNIETFYNLMKRPLKRYKIAYEGIWIVRIKNKVIWKLKRMLKK